MIKIESHVSPSPSSPEFSVWVNVSSVKETDQEPDASLELTSSRPTNQWIHIVYSVVGSNNSSHAVYQDGSALSATNQGGGHGGSAGWAIGGNAQNSERFAMGRIGSIRFFNKALSSSEASSLYTNDKFFT